MNRANDLALQQSRIAHTLLVQRQAYIGELATSETVEGRGVGTALVKACEQWAREQGYMLLTLTTGIANARALSFYHHLGFLDEDVTLTKLL
jgi:GNAT superfamily N-acetyltransferase